MTVQRGISSYDWLPANDLIKVVAMVLMVIDHMAWAFSRHPALWRALGRGAFPLFAALLVVGMRRTRSPHRYLTRLILFALVSQFPFALCFSGLNIGFTLVVGGLALYTGENILERDRQAGRPLRGWLGWTALMGAAGVVASLLRMDYGGMGILAMVILQRSPTAQVGIPLMDGLDRPIRLVASLVGSLLGCAGGRCCPAHRVVAARLETTFSAPVDCLRLLPRPSDHHRRHPRHLGSRRAEQAACTRTCHDDRSGTSGASPRCSYSCTSSKPETGRQEDFLYWRRDKHLRRFWRVAKPIFFVKFMQHASK